MRKKGVGFHRSGSGLFTISLETQSLKPENKKDLFEISVIENG